MAWLSILERRQRCRFHLDPYLFGGRFTIPRTDTDAPSRPPPSSVALRRRFRSMELDVMQCPIRLSTERRLSIAPWVTESLSTVREASHFTRRRRSQWSRLPDCTSLDSNSSTISWFALLLANMKPRWPQYFLLNKSLWRTRVFVETNTRFCRQTFFELLTNL